MKTMVETMADMVAIPAGDIDDVEAMQDRIHAKHSRSMDRLATETAEKIKRAAFDWSERSILDSYYHDRRSNEREYVAALNATQRVARFLAD